MAATILFYRQILKECVGKCTMKNNVNHAHIYTSQHLYMVNHATIMRRIPAWLWFREPSVRTSGETILSSRTPTQARFQPVSY